jgi:hypothetical protein
MKHPITWMVAGCLLSAGLAAWLDPADRVGVAAGMAGPLVSAIGTWVLVDRSVRTDPLRLTDRLMVAMAVKVLFFGGYVVLVVRVFAVPTTPFVTSFVTYFVALLATEALLLRRAFAPAARTR